MLRRLLVVCSLALALTLRSPPTAPLETSTASRV